MTDYLVKEEQPLYRMRREIESSLRWNHITRMYYKGLYEASGDERYLQRYYRALHYAIMLRGRHCLHYKDRESSQ